MENRKGFTERICKMAAVGLTAAVLPAAVFSGEAGTVRAEGTTETVYAAAYVGAESTEETTLPDTVKVDGSDCTVAWDMDSAAFDTAYDTVTVNGMAEGGTEVSAQVEVIPENLVYFISGGTGTGYVNKNTKAAVSEPFNAISGLADLKNDTSDALYSEESGWGHLSDSTYLISATVENGDRPDDYTSVNKYTVGLRDKSSGAAPMTYRFTLEAGKYEMTVGYHEFYGANRSRDMQPSVTWTDFGGSEQTVEGDLIQLRSADQTGVISFELDSTCVVEFQLEKVSGEAPMYSWIGISRTGDAEMEAGYTVTYLAKILEVDTGSRLRAYFMHEGRLRPRILQVCGIYATGLENFDETYILGDIRQIRQINGWADDEAEGIDIQLEDPRKRFDVAYSLGSRLPYEYSCFPCDLLYPEIFDWLALIDTNVLVLMLIMLIVCLICLISILFILIIERKPHVWILRTMGASDGLIRRIFVKQTLLVLGKGMLWGNAVALSLCLIQKCSGLIRLDVQVYYLDRVPIAFPWGTILLTNAAVFISACILLQAVSGILKRKDRQKKREKQHQRGEYTSKVPSS